MPLPKSIEAAIKALLKDGAELPPELESLVVFNNDGEFLSAAEKKTKGKVSAAEQKAVQAAKEARDAAVKEICEKLGVTDADQIEEIKTRLATAEGTISEAEKLKSENTKLAKELKKAAESIAELSGFKAEVAKDKALAPHLAKVHPDLRDDMASLWKGKLTIDGDKITAPEGKAIDAFIDEQIKAKPYLKAPDYKPGAGTGPQGGKTDAKTDDVKKTPEQIAAEKPKSIREAVAQGLAAKAAAGEQLSGP